jgi:cytochrome c peroxidase
MLKASKFLKAGMLMFVGGCGAYDDTGPPDPEGVEQVQSSLLSSPNEAGWAETLHLSGTIDRTNPFFQQLGTNPRSCEACHNAGQGWTINAESVTRLMKETKALDPLFNLVDEGSRPDADVSTYQARIATFKPTLGKKALTRFTRTIPATAEFTLAAISDPSGWSTTTSFVSFRRPTPTANESKASTTNWNGLPAVDVLTQVRGTMAGAPRLHSQRDPANPLPPEQATAGGDFMFGVIFAQMKDREAGRLDDDGAKGGPAHLMAQEWYLGINDVSGNDPQGRPFNPKVFNLFDAWAKYDDDDRHNRCNDRGRARAAIYRGQEVFNTVGKCSGCHNSPNVGGHSVPKFFNIGTAEGASCDFDILPKLTFKNKVTGEEKVMCDAGRGLSSGKWDDLGRFRAPPLRGVAARAPYFHDGQAKNLKEVIRHYDERFSLQLTGKQKRDLEAFLQAL